ncbi:MAG TPA: LysR family transcriptional regulator [Ramlibacter sp.]|jgi:DNA-binding transcriptional LysR family regulator|uniref:LysR family transcriptional regulator n=1 Tax=Ramlibacter sp. TaxID=1917967 RepID=UPI002D32D089|nr:LysR family transcriptional regulator [Ramlibacter sp.]HZY18028.1 LysR family transcriptional regulator [Ramlibacter sp.]
MEQPLIELRLWRQFVAVAETLHFGRAATRLHMTQPPLTQAIAQLERALQVRLFDRTKRSVQLTEAGAALLPQARELLARARAMPAQAQAAAAGEAGRLRLAFVSTVGYHLLPQWVRAFRAMHPGVQLELVEATGDVQLPALERGDIDAGFLLHSPGFAPASLDHLRVAREPLVLAVPEPHPLASARALPLERVMAEPLVIFPRRILPSLHDAVFGLYHAAGREPSVAQEAIQMQTIVNLVSAGLGLAWVPQSVREFQRQGVVYRAPAPARVPHCETSLAWRRESGSGALARFIEFARRQPGVAA